MFARRPSQRRGAALYRVFLRDGSTLLSYGEFARVADRVVMSVPLGQRRPVRTCSSQHSGRRRSTGRRPTRTPIRCARRDTPATRGPDEFALLSARGLDARSTDIALTTDPGRKIAMAVEARQNVTRWVAEHYGYRAERRRRGWPALFDEVDGRDAEAPRA